VGEGPFVAHGQVKKQKEAFATASIHREHHDDRVLTFIAHLAPGLYHFRYLARATSSGSFVVPPTRVEAMYAPEIVGRTAATTLTVGRE
jgi:alpha-2-macroglobulin